MGDWIVRPPESTLRIEFEESRDQVEIEERPAGVVVYGFDRRVLLVRKGQREVELRGDNALGPWPAPSPEYVRRVRDALWHGPYPKEGHIGNLELWSSDIAGWVTSIADGAPLRHMDASNPLPDPETADAIRALRVKPIRTADEAAVVDFFDMHEEGRILAMWAWRAGHPRAS